MQCSYDTRGNSVPTILLLMQEKLYAQDGLKVCNNFSSFSCNFSKEIAYKLPGNLFDYLFFYLNNVPGRGDFSDKSREQSRGTC